MAKQKAKSGLNKGKRSAQADAGTSGDVQVNFRPVRDSPRLILMNSLSQFESALQSMLRQPPLQRVEAVRPFWQSLTDDKRAELLTITIAKLRETAKQVAKMAVLDAGQDTHACNTGNQTACMTGDHPGAGLWVRALRYI